MKRLISGGAASFVAATIILLTPVQEAQAQPWLCAYHAHSGAAVGNTRTAGLSGARANWRKKVRLHDGLRWTNYARACDRDEFCGRPYGGLRHCTVSARPARTERPWERPLRTGARL
jgi:hypothetical protein